MKKSDPQYSKALTRYCDMMVAGKGSAEALKATGLSHAQAGLAWYGDSRNPKGVSFDPKFGTLSETAQNAKLIQMRLEKLSWGAIMVITGWTEGKVRGRFGAATGLASEGMRTGKGGRFLSREPRFYLGNRKGIGVEDKKPRLLDPKAVAAASENATSKLPQLVSGSRKAAAKRVTAKAKPKKKASA